MQPMLNRVLLAFAVSGNVGTALTLRSAQTPVSGVVELLKYLQAQIVSDGKKEEDLYEKYVCWGKSVTEQKTAMIDDANHRVGALETYISDLDNGRIELTTERAELQKEIEQLLGDIQIATDLRNQQRADYNAAKDEMEQAITALTDAVEVLSTATKNNTKGTFVALRTELNQGEAASAREAASLHRAADLGEKFLTKSDAHFLRRLLTGDVPKADWKKLNRKATFKSGYKARSGKIQDVLANLLATFQSNLVDASSKEAEAESLFEKLSTAKEEQLAAAQDALAKEEKENGAKGLSKADAQSEIDTLKQQVTDDTKYVQQVTKALADKKQEWQERQTLRAGELSAISEAIEILNNDDTRDTLKRSYASQGVMLLQVHSESAAGARGSALVTLRNAARRSGDARLLDLVKALSGSSTGNHFDAVIAAIDRIIAVLRNEEAEDFRVKEQCEDSRASNTRKAAKESRLMDELTESMTTLKAEIEDLTRQISAAEEEEQQVRDEMTEANRLREDEKVAYAASKKDDEAALKAVNDAVGVLEAFYSEHKASLVQNRQPSVQAGKAPPPPPKTWEEPNLVKNQESSGIIAILKMLAEDIKKDMKKANSEETKAQNTYDKTKGEQEDKLGELDTELTELNSTRSAKMDAHSTAETDRATKKDEVDAVVRAIQGSEPSCDFFTVNFPVRHNNRNIEIGGLLKAKAILRGAKFDALSDDRELKPGDAM